MLERKERMDNLYFELSTIHMISMKKTIDKYMPLSIEFKYNTYSHTHNWIEYQTPNHFMEFSIGNEFGELISFTLVRHKMYNFISGNIELSQYPLHEVITGIKIKNYENVKKEFYNNGFYYTISESCIVDVYNDALKVSMTNAPEPVFCIMNNDFGVLTDIELNICSFVLKGITLVEHAYFQDHAKRST